VLAAGGQGGMGNIHFKSSLNRAPANGRPARKANTATCAWN